jgi:sialate O-acetylesterase
MSLVIELGRIDELDVTYLDGKKIGSTVRAKDRDQERVYMVPSQLVSRQEHTLAIRIVNTREQGGLVGKPEQLRAYPAGKKEAEPIPLAGIWKFKQAYEFPELSAFSNPKTPTVLYNGMLYPLKNFAIKGAIWYQGESNVGRAFQYREIFPAMIEDWRSLWQAGDFPFYFVQIAPYHYGDEYTGAELREAQMLTLSRVRNTGMAVTMDIGNPNDIHPTNKRDVGRRLALWALAMDYGKEVVYSGPLYKEQQVEGNSIRLFFDYCGDGLEARDGLLSHFEIAGADRVYHPAFAVIEGNTVVASSAQVPVPVAVRYGWRNTDEPNLFNSAGLPASSFCTDSWPRITEK